MMLFVKALIFMADGGADCWDSETIGCRLRRRARISQPRAVGVSVLVRLLLPARLTLRTINPTAALVCKRVGCV